MAYITHAGIIRAHNINEICGLVHLITDMVASKNNGSYDNNNGKIGYKWTDNEHSTTYHTNTNHGITQWYQTYCFLVFVLLIIQFIYREPLYIDGVVNKKPINMGQAKHVPIIPPTSESDMINVTNHFLPHVKSNCVAIDSYSSKKGVYLEALQKIYIFLGEW